MTGVKDVRKTTKLSANKVQNFWVQNTKCVGIVIPFSTKTRHKHNTTFDIPKV